MVLSCRRIAFGRVIVLLREVRRGLWVRWQRGGVVVGVAGVELAVMSLSVSEVGRGGLLLETKGESESETKLEHAGFMVTSTTSSTSLCCSQLFDTFDQHHQISSLKY